MQPADFFLFRDKPLSLGDRTLRHAPCTDAIAQQPQRKSRLGHALWRFSAASVTIASVFTLSVPSQAAFFDQNEYDICAAALLEADLPAAEVAAGCARVLHPEDLATCVVDIDSQTDISAQDALYTCIQVRRPVELATCVVDISQISEVSIAPAILDSCRRSLLPERFSQCVVGLSYNIDILPTQAMATCIDARDRVRDFFPNFPQQ